jgi:Ran GTPase-activating protein (RanGAP) involved in mRNA processing and transport
MPKINKKEQERKRAEAKARVKAERAAKKAEDARIKAEKKALKDAEKASEAAQVVMAQAWEATIASSAVAKDAMERVVKETAERKKIEVEKARIFAEEERKTKAENERKRRNKATVDAVLCINDTADFSNSTYSLDDSANTLRTIVCISTESPLIRLKKMQTDLEELGKEVASGHVREINMFNRHVGLEGVDFLAQYWSQSKSKLSTLDLSANELGGDGRAMDIIAALITTSHSLEVLKLNFNPIGDAGAKKLAEGLAASAKGSVETLSLVGCGITDTGAKELAEVLEMKQCKLKKLILSENEIGNAGGAALAGALEGNKTLLSLQLSTNSLGDEAGVAFGRMLGVNSRLKQLFFGKNNLGDETVEALVEGLESNHCLEQVRLDGNVFSDKVMLLLANVLQDKPYFKVADFGDGTFERKATAVVEEKVKQQKQAALAEEQWQKMMGELKLEEDTKKKGKKGKKKEKKKKGGRGAKKAEVDPNLPKRFVTPSKTMMGDYTLGLPFDDEQKTDLLEGGMDKLMLSIERTPMQEIMVPVEAAVLAEDGETPVKKADELDLDGFDDDEDDEEDNDDDDDDDDDDGDGDDEGEEGEEGEDKGKEDGGVGKFAAETPSKNKPASVSAKQLGSASRGPPKFKERVLYPRRLRDEAMRTREEALGELMSQDEREPTTSYAQIARRVEHTLGARQVKSAHGDRFTEAKTYRMFHTKYYSNERRMPTYSKEGHKDHVLHEMREGRLGDKCLPFKNSSKYSAHSQPLLQNPAKTIFARHGDTSTDLSGLCTATIMPGSGERGGGGGAREIQSLISYFYYTVSPPLKTYSRSNYAHLPRHVDTRIRYKFGNEWWAGTVKGEYPGCRRWYTVHFDNGSQRTLELDMLKFGAGVCEILSRTAAAPF